MAPSRKQSNGRSPLVNPQRQITSFFSKTTSPSPTLSKKQTPNSPHNPNPSPSPSSSPSPTTPSPLQSKPEKPLLVIGQTPSPSTPGTTNSATKAYGNEVVEKRIRVYWPLDKSWYEGCVKSYDKDSGKHLVQYDDFEEELLDLGHEKIEWVEETAKKFKRLRRGSLAFKKIATDEEMEDVEEDNVGGDGDDSSDEDWGKNAEKEISEEEENVDLGDEEEEADEEIDKKPAVKSESRKRKVSGGGKLGSEKKGKGGGDVRNGGFKVSVVEPVKNKENGASNSLNNTLTSDASERFSMREAEKLPFLGA